MTKKQQQPRRRHVPLRTCVACRTQRPKRALVRVVRLSGGEIVVDETGKRNGRGAYVCRQRPCWERVLKSGALKRALRASPSEAEAAALREYAATLPETLSVAPQEAGSSESTEEDKASLKE